MFRFSYNNCIPTKLKQAMAENKVPRGLSIIQNGGRHPENNEYIIPS